MGGKKGQGMRRGLEDYVELFVCVCARMRVCEREREKVVCV